MGGRAFLEEYSTVRVEAAEYTALSREIVTAIGRAAGADRRIVGIPAYRTKPSFGDIDILIDKADLDVTEFRLRVQQELGSPALKVNGDVVSYLAQAREGLFQVDLLLSPAAEFDFALGYFSFNDLGNLIGRVAHKQGFKFGHGGLWYTYREGTYAFRDILLTRDFPQALVFLGYDPERFLAGFETLLDVFVYASSTWLFNPTIYHLDNRNHRSRVRDRKRKTYTDFLAWLEGPAKALNLPSFEYETDKSVYLPRAFEHFPLFEQELERATKDLEKSRQVKAKLSGEFVMQVTGRTGTEVGAIMTALKASHASHEDYVKWVLGSGDTELRQAILAADSATRSTQ